MRSMLFLLLVCGIVHAEAPKKDPAPKKEQAAAPKAAVKAAGVNPQVLDFDSDVIEGERKSPDLFLQLQVDTPNLDTLLYQRQDFNDFHSVQKSRRPLYRKAAQ